MDFRYTTKTEITTVQIDSTGSTDFYNLKNRAEGARRYGYQTIIRKYVNEDGATAFAAEYQTLLNGARYQSSKRSAFVSTEAEARALLAKTIAGAMKRYAKLATNPASKIEHRP
jgi:hypothetical protein